MSQALVLNRLTQIGKVLLPVLLIGVSLSLLALTFLNLKPALLTLDGGYSESLTRIAENRNEELLQFTELHISTAQPLPGEPLELQGLVTNQSSGSLQFGIGLAVASTNLEAASRQSASTSPNDYSLVVRSNNASKILLSSGEQRSFRIIFEFQKSGLEPLRLGLAAVGLNSGQNSILQEVTLVDNFTVHQNDGFEVITSLLLQFPPGLTFLAALVILSLVISWKSLFLRTKLIAWKIVTSDRAGAVQFYLLVHRP